ncbi:MAG: ATP-binding cassette domain-containing protein, partial [Caldilineaceae bacterium]|nr:ATP-binding cassette domain-containing protein [Caldilineaceae bacterium]
PERNGKYLSVHPVQNMARLVSNLGFPGSCLRQTLKERFQMPSENIIEVRDLVKVYPGGHHAVAGIDFDIPREGFFGFLGPNGAGKTTTMKILGTLLRKTSGTVTVAGYDVDTDPQAIRRSIGFAMQEVGLDDLAKGRDFLQLQGVLYGLSRREARRKVAELLELVGLAQVAGQRVGTYSGGMRRRLDLAGALMHDPDILFLDEPTVGLDPQSRITMWEHLDNLNAKGVTILLTTQAMEEADRLCRSIAIIDHGQIVARGSPETLKAEVGGDVVQIALHGSGDSPNDALNKRAEGLVGRQRYVETIDRAEGGIAVTVKDGSAAVPDLVGLLHENPIPASGLSVARPTLDQVFLKYTGRTIRAEEATGDGVGEMMRPMTGLNRRMP